VGVVGPIIEAPWRARRPSWCQISNHVKSILLPNFTGFMQRLGQRRRERQPGLRDTSRCRARSARRTARTSCSTHCLLWQLKQTSFMFSRRVLPWHVLAPGSPILASETSGRTETGGPVVPRNAHPDVVCHRLVGRGRHVAGRAGRRHRVVLAHDPLIGESRFILSTLAGRRRCRASTPRRSPSAGGRGPCGTCRRCSDGAPGRPRTSGGCGRRCSSPRSRPG
jgi:hypothetical protein